MGDSSSFPMKGGDDAFSYTHNSLLQREVSNFVKALIHDAIIGKLEADISATVRIADFGCSVGPNTFSTIQNIIDAVEKRGGTAEFEVFFNDQISNDFNTLFASLPTPRQYYAAAVPGSFHGRLFPSGSITLAHSSFSLHFLSQVPEGVADRESRAWNGGSIHCMREGTCGHVLKAYSDQFGRDMVVFLRSRGEEMMKGGLMLLTIPSQGSNSRFLDHIESCILELVQEGVMEKGEIDAFNLAVYLPSEEEVTKLIEENGRFSIERVELTSPRTRMSARAIAIHFRAIFEDKFRSKFGDSLMEKIFAKSLEKADENPQLLEAALYHAHCLFYALKRK